MTSSTHIALRRMGLVLATAVLGAVLAGSALAGNGSGSNLPPQAAIDAASANWAAKAKLLDVNGQPRVSLFVPNAAIDAASANWAAKAKLLDVNGQPRVSLFVPNAAIDAASANWAAKAKLLDVNGQPVHPTPRSRAGARAASTGPTSVSGPARCSASCCSQRGCWPAPTTAARAACVRTPPRRRDLSRDPAGAPSLVAAPAGSNPEVRLAHDGLPS